MNLTKYLIIMTMATTTCLAIWFYILNNIDPANTNIIGHILFYASLGLSLVGILSLVGFGVRKIAIKKEVDFRHVYVSFRQSVFLSLIFITVLILQSQKLLNFTNITLLAVALISLELFLVSRKSV